MTNLPAQAHGSSVATTRTEADAYAIDQSMVKLPSLYLAQYQSTAFKARTVEFGDIFVALGADDPQPTVLGSTTKAVRFYVHGVQPGYQVVDKSAPYGKRTLRLGTSYPDAIREAGGKPQDVFLQTHLSLTIPEYPLLPVRFIMGSRWGGNAARWLNSQISMALMQKKRPLDLAFQIQTRATSNDSGDFVDALVGFAKVAAKQAKEDQEIIAQHAELLSTVTVDVSDEEPTATASEAPSLA